MLRLFRGKRKEEKTVKGGKGKMVVEEEEEEKGGFPSFKRKGRRGRKRLTRRRREPHYYYYYKKRVEKSLGMVGGRRRRKKRGRNGLLSLLFFPLSFQQAGVGFIFSPPPRSRNKTLESENWVNQQQPPTRASSLCVCMRWHCTQFPPPSEQHQ